MPSAKGHRSVKDEGKMKLLDTKQAVGHVLCHDLTQIIPGVTTTMAPDTFVVELKSVTDFKK